MQRIFWSLDSRFTLTSSLSSCPTLNVTLLSRHEFMEVTVGVFNGLGSNLRKRTYIYTLDIALMLLMFNKAGLCFNKVIKSIKVFLGFE